ncbi:hypothetical protein PGT21_006301 [Puccinia graminis f. sp. tritici]|uniref:Uncharacterized protein n=1 Tax=Puccinia graminis f. sp. tritici TaxID=56615 RepID=A0A5B0PQV0_PUCGR|nr:hypothetical protein PGT21_006301 [Puccinia graminis f. sp. tritici]
MLKILLTVYYQRYCPTLDPAVAHPRSFLWISTVCPLRDQLYCFQNNLLLGIATDPPIRPYPPDRLCQDQIKPTAPPLSTRSTQTHRSSQVSRALKLTDPPLFRSTKTCLSYSVKIEYIIGSPLTI